MSCSRSSWIRRIVAATASSAALTLGGLMTTVTATASTVWVDDSSPDSAEFPYGHWVKFSGEEDVEHHVSVAVGASGYVVTDSTASVTVGTGCSLADEHTAVCTLTSPAQLGLYAWLGNVDDSFVSTAATHSLVYAGAGDDDIRGGPGDDTLSGMSGTDTVDGGSGNDRLWSYGQIGRETLLGGAGTDTVRYGDSNSFPAIGVHVSIDGQANDGYSGAPLEEQDNVGLDVENVVGTNGDDVITGSDAANTLDGNEGDDQLNGAGGDDRFTLYHPGFERATISGGEGVDTFDVSGGYIFNDGMTIALDGQSHGGQTIGTDVENAIGGTAADTITGNAADNQLDGGPGSCSDTLDGQTGNDTVSYATHTWGVTVDGMHTGGNAGYQQYCAEESDALSDFENAVGSPSADVLGGDASANRLAGGGGDDRLNGGGGPDVLSGGGGRDTADYSLRTAAVNVVANGLPVSGNSDDGAAGSRDSVSTDVENLIGGTGGDALTGNGSANLLEGGVGNDTLNGQGDNDLLRGSGGADTLAGGAGVDLADYASRTADLEIKFDDAPNDGEAGEGDNVGPGGDVEDVTAGSGSDLLLGNGRANRLDGGAGDDLLDGGAGTDVAIGGAGADVVSYLLATVPVAAAINGAPTSGGPADGPVGARDTIGHDIEDLWGGSAGDSLTGDGGDNLLYGGDGPDTLNGGGGDDAADYSDRTSGVRAALDGRPESGNDADGPAGARDRLGTDVEVLFGGAGGDALSGNASANFFDAGPGDDEVNSRDASEDATFCGDGNDTALLDELDLYHATCEAAYLPGEEPRPSGPAAPAGVRAPTDTAAPRLRVSTPGAQRLSRILRKGLAVSVSCSETCRLDGRLSLDGRTAKRLGLTKRRKPVVVARGRAASSGRLLLRFSSKARKGLRRARRLRMTLVIRARDAADNAVSVTRRVTLTRKRVSLSARPAATPQTLARLASSVSAAHLAQRKMSRTSPGRARR